MPPSGQIKNANLHNYYEKPLLYFLESSDTDTRKWSRPSLPPRLHTWEGGAAGGPYHDPACSLKLHKDNNKDTSQVHFQRRATCIQNGISQGIQWLLANFSKPWQTNDPEMKTPLSIWPTISPCLWICQSSVWEQQQKKRQNKKKKDTLLIIRKDV